MAAPLTNNRAPRWVNGQRRKPVTRTTLLTRLSVLWGMGLAVGKLVMGLSVASVFLCLHAFYTACMGLARWLFVRVQTGGRPFGLWSARGCYPAMGGIVLSASVFYMLYSLRLFLGQPSPRYHRYVAIAIAIFTLAEIVLNIYGSVTARRRSVKTHGQSGALQKRRCLRTAFCARAYKSPAKNAAVYTGARKAATPEKDR